MKITRIEIEKYKSIKEPIEINFYDNPPTVLIGKNGSEKTNILEALDTIAEVNSNYFGAKGISEIRRGFGVEYHTRTGQGLYRRCNTM